MELTIHLIAYLTLIYSVALLIKKEKHSTDIILAVWLAFVAISYGPGIFKWELALGYTHSVFLYTYIKCVLQNKKFEQKDVLHFIPFFIVATLFLISPDRLFYKYLFIIQGISAAYSATYIFLSVRLIINYKKRNILPESNSLSPNMFWLSFNAGIVALSYSLKVITGVIFIIWGYSLGTITNFIILILLNIVGIVALRMNLQFFHKNPESDAKGKVYSTYHLSDEEISELEIRLKKLMEGQKLYLNPELSMRNLADNLKAPSHHISYLLNVRFNQNFYEFINNYRLEAVKEELVNPQNKDLSIFAIACDCGFNSQSTFNRIFKQKMGISPSKYREQHLVLV